MCTPSNSDQAPVPQIEGVEIGELIGRGGYALVFKGRQKLLDRSVAVKVLNIDALNGESINKRFQSELKLSSSLDHPNIAKTMNSGVCEDGRPYMLMELASGGTLEDEFKTGTALSFRRFREIFIPVLSALETAHSKGIIHRDLKPANIVICENDGLQTVKLVDFGIAKIISDNQQAITQTGALIGSPAYMSPEQCKGQKNLDARSDIYSICCVMFEALFGRTPFRAENQFELMQKHLLEELPDAKLLAKSSNIPEKLLRIILSGLQKDPALRPASATELKASLSTALEAITLDKLPSSTPAPKADHRLVLLAGFLVIASLAVLAALTVKRVPLSATTATKENKQQLRTSPRGGPYSQLRQLSKELDNSQGSGNAALERVLKDFETVLTEVTNDEPLKYVALMRINQLERRLNRALNVRRKNLQLALACGGGKDLLRCSECYSSLADIALCENKITEAQNYAEKALSIEEKSQAGETKSYLDIPLDLQTSSRKDVMAAALQTLTRVSERKHDYKKAVEYSQRRTDLLLSYGGDIGTRIAVSDEILELCKDGLLDEAIRTLKKLEIEGASPESIKARARIQSCLLAAKKTDLSFSMAKESLDLSRKIDLTKSLKRELEAQYSAAKSEKISSARKHN